MTIIERFRRAVGWTQVELAEALGKSNKNVWQWEHRERGIKPDDAWRFLAVARTHGYDYTLEDVYPPPPDVKRRRR